MYISEIQHNIEEAFGVKVAETTISRSLYCCGYSRKKVRSSLMLDLVLLVTDLCYVLGYSRRNQVQ